jgi:cytoskeletal protein CcmA (bactofilin family)
MVTVLAVASIMLVLLTVMMTQIIHAGDQTGRDRNRMQSFHVAEAGLARAYAALATNPAFTGSTESVTAGGVNVGSFTTEVVAGGTAFDRVVTSTGTTAGGNVRKVSQGVTLSPLGGFNFALLSATTTTLSNHLIVNGDSFANQATTLTNHTDIVGNIVSPSNVTTDANSTIDGDVISGGNVVIANGTTVNGNVFATGTATIQGVVQGDVQAMNVVLSGGSIHGQTISGATVPAPATRTLPAFTYNAANYAPTVPSAMTVAAFNTYWTLNRTSMAGVFTINDIIGTVTSPNQKTTLSGDLTIITNRPVAISRDFMSSDGATKRLVVISTSTSNSPAALSMTNNITMPPNVQTFLFTNGTASFVNQKDFHGIVYANKITQGNNFTLTYESALRDNPPPGFTWDTSSAGAYDLVLGVWRECNGPGGTCV